MTTGPFGKDVAKVYHGIKEKVADMPIIPPLNEDGSQPVVPQGAIDRNVKEQVVSDIDGLIKQNEARKY